MVSFGDITDGTSGLIKSLDKGIDALNAGNPLTQGQLDQFRSDGFLLPPTFSADGTGLPYSKVTSNKEGTLRRNIITWFVPEFGAVKMYINPQQIQYTHKKLIHRDKTKGGYTVQYWGEELGIITLSGTTGSSGIEGINMLYEIYRAEQYAFDAVGLTLAANNAATDLANNAINAVGGAIGGALFGSGSGSAGAGLLGGLLGAESPNNSLAAKNINSLAQLACTVELFYNGWAFRGFFDNMTITEKANDFLIDYQITFITTQRRGYRINQFAWAKSAKDGPSSYSSPLSYSGNVK